MELGIWRKAAFQLEDDAGKELGRSVESWLDGPFIQWHTSLYKSGPSSGIWPANNSFAVLLYHKLDKAYAAKIRNVYLRALRDGLRRQLDAARQTSDSKTITQLETTLDDLLQMEEGCKLSLIPATTRSLTTASKPASLPPTGKPGCCAAARWCNGDDVIPLALSWRNQTLGFFAPESDRRSSSSPTTILPDGSGTLEMNLLVLNYHGIFLLVEKWWGRVKPTRPIGCKPGSATPARSPA